MGRLTLDDISNSKLFLNKVYSLFQIVRPYLKVSKSLYSKEAEDLFDMVYYALFEMETKEIPNRYVVRHFYNNSKDWIKFEKDGYMPYINAGCYASSLDRKMHKDYSNPGCYKEIWGIDYQNTNGKEIINSSVHENNLYVSILPLRTSPMINESVRHWKDSDSLTIYAGKERLVIQVDSKGYFILCYCPNVDNEITDVDPWNEREPNWNVWLLSPNSEETKGKLAKRPKLQHQPSTTSPKPTQKPKTSYQSAEEICNLHTDDWTDREMSISMGLFRLSDGRLPDWKPLVDNSSINIIRRTAASIYCCADYIKRKYTTNDYLFAVEASNLTKALKSSPVRERTLDNGVIKIITLSGITLKYMANCGSYIPDKNGQNEFMQVISSDRKIVITLQYFGISGDWEPEFFITYQKGSKSYSLHTHSNYLYPKFLPLATKK